MQHNDEITCIQVRKGTRKRLKAIGDMNDTYDSVINKLLDAYEEKTWQT